MLFITSCLHTFGRYALFMQKVLTKPDRWRESLKRYVVEISKLGVDSIPLVIVISLFIGSVIAIQMQINFSNPLLPTYTIGLATRDVLLLEFSSSILCLIFGLILVHIICKNYITSRINFLSSSIHCSKDKLKLVFI